MLKNISVLQLFISRMPKILAILQLVSAPLNPIGALVNPGDDPAGMDLFIFVFIIRVKEARDVI